MSSNVEFYQRMEDLQNFQHESERRRMQLEQKLNKHVKSDRKINRLRASKLQAQWRKVCEDERKSQLRNEKLMKDVERVENHLSSLSAKTDRLRLLKEQYEDYIERMYPKWKERIIQNQQMAENAETLPQSYDPSFATQFFATKENFPPSSTRLGSTMPPTAVSGSLGSSYIPSSLGLPPRGNYTAATGLPQPGVLQNRNYAQTQLPQTTGLPVHPPEQFHPPSEYNYNQYPGLGDTGTSFVTPSLNASQLGSVTPMSTLNSQGGLVYPGLGGHPGGLQTSPQTHQASSLPGTFQRPHLAQSLPPQYMMSQLATPQGGRLPLQGYPQHYVASEQSVPMGTMQSQGPAGTQHLGTAEMNLAQSHVPPQNAERQESKMTSQPVIQQQHQKQQQQHHHQQQQQQQQQHQQHHQQSKQQQRAAVPPAKQSPLNVTGPKKEVQAVDSSRPDDDLLDSFTLSGSTDKEPVENLAQEITNVNESKTTLGKETDVGQPEVDILTVTEQNDTRKDMKSDHASSDADTETSLSDGEISPRIKPAFQRSHSNVDPSPREREGTAVRMERRPSLQSPRHVQTPSTPRSTRTPPRVQSPSQRKPSISSAKDVTSPLQSPREAPEISESEPPSTPRKPDLTLDGLYSLLQAIQEDFPVTYAPETYYRFKHPTSQKKKEIISSANLSQPLSDYDPAEMSMVVLDELPLLVGQRKGGSLLTEKALTSKRPITSELDIRSHIFTTSLELWDRLFDHFAALIKNNVMRADQVAALFAHTLVPANSKNKDKAVELLRTLLENRMAVTLPPPDDESSSVSIPSPPLSPRESKVLEKVHEEQETKVPALNLGSTAGLTESESEEDFFTQPVPKEDLTQTAAYQSLLSGTAVNPVKDDDSDGSEDSLEKQLAMVVAPGEARVKSPTALSSGRSVVTPTYSTGKKPAALRTGSDLDTDSEVENQMSAGGAIDDDQDDFDFYD
ncbi:mastermind-like protein 2 isoform X2 [Lingula anatina]|uniref:Centrosomal protein kizuna n=1 Tax=Lingula anatina TaxID=7574 RepID=A0A2R2MT51_LINAN|nr:mastermind-like protein 2 isoform X2 [Lingula anatina]|eukprot:XP_023933429.1 mastermind-like protein 2 isoform X2 [Lingula anatina]